MVEVRLHGALAWVAGTEVLQVPVNGEISIRDLIRRVVEAKPEVGSVLVDCEVGDPRVNNLILVNGREVSVLNGLETTVSNDDVVDVICLIRAAPT